MNSKVEFLKNNGVDMESALSYLTDIETFNEIIEDFYNEVDSSIETLKKYKDSGDINNYTIAVHALKSNCRTLGIKEFAEVAYTHEVKSKENDTYYISEHFIDLIELTKKWKQIIKDYLEK